MTKTAEIRGLCVTFKTPMKWTIEEPTQEGHEPVVRYVNEKIIYLVFSKSEPSGANWWLIAVTPHEPNTESSMFLWFHRRFGRARYRAATEEQDLDDWKKWNDEIIRNNVHIESIEIAADPDQWGM